SFRVDAPVHTYHEEGTYNVTVTVQHEGAAALTTGTTATITVTEVQISALTAVASAQTIAEAGSTAAITGIATFTDPGYGGALESPAAPHTGTINWQDGTTSAGTDVNTRGTPIPRRAPGPTHTQSRPETA